MFHFAFNYQWPIIVSLKQPINL